MFRAQGLGFRVKAIGLKVWGLRSRVQGTLLSVVMFYNGKQKDKTGNVTWKLRSSISL